MTIEEMQKRLDEMFPSGARVVLDPHGGDNASIRITARVLSVNDGVLMYSPVDYPRAMVIAFADDPDFSDSTVTMTNQDGVLVRIDGRFNPPAWMKQDLEYQRAEVYNNEMLESVRKYPHFSREDLIAS